MTAETAFALTLPPAPEFVGSARTFAAAVARHFGVPDEGVEDLKLAVSEACTEAMPTLAREGGRIEVRALSVGSDLAFEIRVPGSFESTERGEPATFGGPARLELIRSLFPGTDVAPGPQGSPVMRLSLSLG